MYVKNLTLEDISVALRVLESLPRLTNPMDEGDVQALRRIVSPLYELTKAANGTPVNPKRNAFLRKLFQDTCGAYAHRLDSIVQVECRNIEDLVEKNCGSVQQARDFLTALRRVITTSDSL